jgi:7-cyano-7-deazaguanine reductase
MARKRSPPPPRRGAGPVECFPNRHPERDYEIRIVAPEFTAVCPRTGQPDFATLTVVYVPDALCLELKSLKLYLQSYRNRGIYHEHVANAILDDLVKSCAPRRMALTGEFNPRGGIATTVTVSYPARRSRSPRA